MCSFGCLCKKKPLDENLLQQLVRMSSLHCLTFPYIVSLTRKTRLEGTLNFKLELGHMGGWNARGSVRTMCWFGFLGGRCGETTRPLEYLSSLWRVKTFTLYGGCYGLPVDWKIYLLIHSGLINYWTITITRFRAISFRVATNTSLTVNYQENLNDGRMILQWDSEMLGRWGTIKKTLQRKV